MNDPPLLDHAAIAPKDIAPQHGPRPLPLFLQILWKETESDVVLRSKALAGLRRYQTARRSDALAPPRVAAQAGSTRLLHYGTQQTSHSGFAALFVPSLINPPSVLDLSEERSMLRHFAQKGHDPWMIDWGSPGPEDASLDLNGHIESKLLPLARSIGKPVVILGYCLGGTLAIGAATRMAFEGLATIAAPWHFGALPQQSRDSITQLWTSARPLCEQLGYVPMEVLQSGFWQLDPQRTIQKYAAFADMQPRSEAEAGFLAVEDWANAGPPLTFEAGRQLLEDFYQQDHPGTSGWLIDGARASLDSITIPSLSVRSTNDRIVPAECSPRLGETLELALGHVGMIIGGKAERLLWNPLSEWLSKRGA